MPKRFPNQSLGELVSEGRNITYGIVQPGPDVRPEGVPLIRGKDYSSGNVDLSDLYHVRPEIDAPYSRSKVRGGDILFSIVGYVGQTAIVPEELTGANITQTTARISIDPKRADIEFVFQHLSADFYRPQIRRYEKGSAQPGLNLADVERLTIALPPLPVQHRIAEILSTVDEAIEQTEALIAKRQQIKAGLMRDLFTRGVTADGQLRPPREEAPQRYKNSPLGWIPTEWEIVTAGEKLAVIDPQPDHRTPPAALDGYPYVGTGDITPTGDIDFERARKVSVGAFEKQVGSFNIYPRAFIFGKIGTIGQPTRIPHERFFAVSANVVLMTSPNPDDSDYGYWHFRSGLTETQVADATNTTSQPALGIQKVRQFLLAWPSSDNERKAISSRLESISTVLATETLKREKLRRIKAGLMQDLLTGRIPVGVETTPEEREVAASV